MVTNWKPTMSDDPWRHIPPPHESDAISSLRVDANLPWDFFWARGHDKRVMLTLRHDSGVRFPGQAPDAEAH